MLMANDSSEFWKSDDDVVVGGNAVVEGFEGSNDFFFDIDSLSRDLLEDSDQWDDTLLNSPEDLSCNNSFQAGVVPSEVERRSQLELQNCMHESEDVPPREDELLEPSQWCLIDSRAGMGSEQMFGFPETSGMAFDNGKVDPVSHIESPLRTCSVSLTDWSTMSGVEHDTCSSREGDGGAMYAPLYNYDISMMPSEAPSCSTTFNFASGDSSGSTDHVKNEKEIDFMHAGDSHSKCASHLTEMEESDSGYGSHSAAFGNSMEDPRVLEMNFHMSTAEIDFIDVETSLPNPHSIECNGNLVADMRCGDRKIYAEQSSCERSSITAGSSIYKDTHQFLPHFLDLPFMGNREENVICTEVEKKDQLLFSQNIFMNNTVNLEAEEAISVTPTVSAMGFSYTSTYQGTSPKCETSSHCSPTGRESSSDADGCSSSVASWKPMHGSQLFMPRKKEMVCTVDDQRDDLHTSNYSSVRSSAYATDDGPCAALNQLVPDAQSRLSSKRLEVSVKDERKEEINLRRNMSSHHVKANGVVKGNNSVYSHNVDEADVCILEDISHPRNVPPVRHGESLITSQRPVLDPLYHMGMGGTRLKANDETITLRVALQDLSQPKSESSPPDGSLAVPLLRHQRIALSWMVQKEKSSLQCSGGILADDQGLGKTISTIALILTEKPPSAKVAATSVKQNEPKSFNLDDDEDDGGVLHLNGMKQDIHSGQDMMNKSSVKNENAFMLAKGRPAAGTLIVCPTSVLRQWADELRNKVSTNLSILVYHGSNRTKDHFDLAKYDVVLTTYSIVSMEVPKQPLVDKDDDEKGQAEGHGLPPMEFSSSKKRKYPPSGDKKSRKNKKGVDGALLESTARPLARVGWFRVVLDEAQSIKNHRTQVARACWGLRAKRRWCLSGTPIQNAIDDLYSYFRFLRYDPYAAYKSFCSMIKVPISRNPVTGYKKLQAVLKTIMLRRTKGSLLDGEPIINLPPKSIELKRVEFSMEERDFYSKLEADSRAQFKVYAAAGTVKQNYVNILLMLLRLRQACDHPLLVKGYDSSSVWRSSLETAKKLSREKQIQLLNCLEACLDICGICNDPPEDAVVTICGHIFCNQCILEYLTGDENLCPAAQCKVHLNITSVFSRETLRSTLFDQPNHENSATQPVESLEPCSQGPSGSSKIMAALEVLESLSKPCDSSKDGSLKNNEVTKSSGRITEFHSQDKAHLTTESCLNDSSVKVSEKAIVFSQWTRMLDLLEAHLKHSSIQYRRLDGTMSVLARDKAVKDFNTIPEVTVMIMSLKAASLGLNMVAACHVILLDLWWNPTTEDQAIDRAHRIGQTRPVTVLRLTVKDTVEDRILALQQKKREMVSSAFGEDETGSRQTRLTVDDLKYLFMA